MTTRRTVLSVTEWRRILPSVALAVPPTTTVAAQAAATIQVTTGLPWIGHGRYTVTTNRTTNAKTSTFEGSADFGSSGFFGIKGSITTVGNKAGQATGKIVLSNTARDADAEFDGTDAVSQLGSSDEQ